mmetsp:Transcript_125200/g.340033  ORF Transcript_125200/g.340033 Transcript_125200/m.340033 type:complete len:131 (+) Transcript_125200:1-393(+)
MAENGRKGVLEAATEKAAELQEEIDEMEEEKDKEVAVVDAQGDIQAAEQRMLAKKRGFAAKTVSSQFHVLEAALEELESAEGEMRNDGMSQASSHRFKQALHKARTASEMLNRLLERKGSMLMTQMSAAQ